MPRTPRPANCSSYPIFKQNGIVLVVLIGVSPALLSASATLVTVNNQAFIEGYFGSSQYNYGSLHPGDAGAPLFNGDGEQFGARLGFVKTVKGVYGQFSLDSAHATVNYSELGSNNQSLSAGDDTSLSLNARLGYVFYPRETLAFIPYLVGGYVHHQLNTGGYSADFMPATYNGTTFVNPFPYYGVGAIEQWAVSGAWVLSAYTEVGSEISPTTSAHVNNFNNQPDATTTYQKWHSAPGVLWQAGVNSDYQWVKHLHARAGFVYRQERLGEETRPSVGFFPSQSHTSWLVTVGVGQDFAEDETVTEQEAGGGREAIHMVNNQGSAQIGYITQSIKNGTTLSTQTQTGGMPLFGGVLDSTWHKIYTQWSIREALG